MATKVFNQCSCIFQQNLQHSGEIVSITTDMAKLLNQIELGSNNIYQLLQATSNCTLSIINAIKAQIWDKKAIVDVVLKFKSSAMQILLSFIPIKRFDQEHHPLINCIAREVIFPVNIKMLFYPSKPVQNLIPKIKTQLNLGTLKLSEKEKTIMFLLSMGFVQDKIATILKCSRSYIATVISEDLCPKFGIIGCSTVFLTQIAVSMPEFHQEIPKAIEEIFPAMIL